MRRTQSQQMTLLTAAGFCAGATLLFFSPPAFEHSLRGAILDLVVSGQDCVATNYFHWRRRAELRSVSNNPELKKPFSNSEPSLSPVQNNSRIRDLEVACRQLRIENAQLREELKLAESYGVSPIPISKTRSAQPPTAVQAAIINRETLAAWRSVRHLNRGGTHDIVESALVLDEMQPHVDLGSEAGLEPELDVFVGRCVVGRIATVGRWTSTLELVTDPHYRGLAQIIRSTDQGGPSESISFGILGILAGQGTPLCKLNDVPTTQSVRVGDEVYTSNRDNRTPVPLYYGRVVRVEDAGRHWDITVEPAVISAQLRTVNILTIPPMLGKVLAQ